MALQQQIIRGKTYSQYTPEWYEAMDADKAASAAAAGAAAGAGVNGLRAAVPDLFPGANTSSSSSGSTSTGSTIPRATFPSGGTGTGGGGISIPGFPSNGSMPIGAQPHLDVADTHAADEAAFNRSRDLVGQTTKASLTGLRSALASRGQLGGGGEFHGSERIVESGQQQLSDTSREQAIQASQRAAERAALQFQGDVSMRGQNLSASQAAAALAARLQEVQYQGDITQRGQDLASQHDAQSFAMQQSQQQQLILDRILAQLTPLY